MERDHWKELDGKIILNWILKKQNLRVWTGFIWRKIRTRVGPL
jgi:hypothetical protein